MVKDASKLSIRAVPKLRRRSAMVFRLPTVALQDIVYETKRRHTCRSVVKASPRDETGVLGTRLELVGPVRSESRLGRTSCPAEAAMRIARAPW